LALAGDSTITTFIREMSLRPPGEGVRSSRPFGRGYGEPKAACQIRTDRSSARSNRDLDVRLREILALVKKRSACCFGLSVDETVAKIEPRRMPCSLAVAVESLKREMYGDWVHWLDFDPGRRQELHDGPFGLTNRTAPLASKSESRLINGNGCRGRVSSPIERRDEESRSRLAGQNGDDCGSVNNDHSSPLRSSKNALSASNPVEGHFAIRS